MAVKPATLPFVNAKVLPEDAIAGLKFLNYRNMRDEARLNPQVAELNSAHRSSGQQSQLNLI